MNLYISDRCVSCGACASACHGRCISRVDGHMQIDTDKCLNCGSCMTVCNQQAILEVGDTYEHPAHEPRILDCDIVVVGAGGAGLVAAARIAAISEKRVIVLEKMPFIGGGMNFAADWRIYGSQWQARRGIPNLMNEKIRDAMDATNWMLDNKLVYQAYANTGRFFDWFETLVPDATFVEGMYIFDQPHGGQIIPFPVDERGTNKCGLFTAKALQKFCREKGVQILTRHRVVDIEQINGRIHTVVAHDPGGVTRVNCKAVILSTGSWIANDELMKKVCPDYLKVPLRREAHTSLAYAGDGIPIAKKMGAYIDYESLCLRLMGPMGMAPGRAISAISRSPSCIYVNLDGKRWINEDTTIRTDNAFGIANILVKQPQGVSFKLFEREMVDKVYQQLDGKPLPGNADEPGGPLPIPDDYAQELDLLSQPDGMEKLMQRMGGGPGGPGGPGGDPAASQTRAPGVFCGKDLKELAEKAGINYQGLKATVENYNRMCQEGFDKEYFKDAQQLIPFGNGPFYALKGSLSTDGAFGGIQTDADTRVYADPITKSIVPGLYVPGDFSASRFLNYHGFKVQVINDLAWAISSGFSAAEAAVADLGSSGRSSAVKR